MTFQIVQSAGSTSNSVHTSIQNVSLTSYPTPGNKLIMWTFTQNNGEYSGIHTTVSGFTKIARTRRGALTVWTRDVQAGDGIVWTANQSYISNGNSANSRGFAIHILEISGAGTPVVRWIPEVYGHSSTLMNMGEGETDSSSIVLAAFFHTSNSAVSTSNPPADWTATGWTKEVEQISSYGYNSLWSGTGMTEISDFPLNGASSQVPFSICLEVPPAGTTLTEWDYVTRRTVANSGADFTTVASAVNACKVSTAESVWKIVLDESRNFAGSSTIVLENNTTPTALLGPDRHIELTASEEHRHQGASGTGHAHITSRVSGTASVGHVIYLYDPYTALTHLDLQVTLTYNGFNNAAVFVPCRNNDRADHCLIDSCILHYDGSVSTTTTAYTQGIVYSELNSYMESYVSNCVFHGFSADAIHFTTYSVYTGYIDLYVDHCSFAEYGRRLTSSANEWGGIRSSATGAGTYDIYVHNSWFGFGRYGIPLRHGGNGSSNIQFYGSHNLSDETTYYTSNSNVGDNTTDWGL